ncbi:MAG: hypothetical protein IT227_09980 [Flavobacteriales bacterium]|nr:hypothetical protein [Flavobacteriales bacterium]
MYRSLCSAAFSGLVALATAQSFVHQVFVLNEGYYNMNTQTQEVPVSLGSYDPAAGTYQTVATIAGQRFASDVDVADGAVYVAADGQLLKYDADSYALLDQATVPGIRKVALWNGQVLLTRGELGGLPHYFEARDAATLDLLYTLTPADGLLHSAEDVQVVGDKAYLAVGNAFDWGNLVGYLGIVDLIAQSYEQQVDLGPDGRNPERIMVAGQDLYVFCNKDFSGSAISRVATDGAFSYTANVALNSGCGASELVADKVVFSEYAVGRMARFDTGTGGVLDTLASPLFPYSLLHDALNGVLYATTTDFLTSGMLHVLTPDGTELSSTAVGVSPGRLALDVRAGTAVPERTQSGLALFPVPADEQVVVESDAVGELLTLRDASGRVLRQERLATGRHAIDLYGLAPGVYHVQLPGRTAVPVVKR